MAFIQKSVTDERGFGADLRELRELRGWTREQLSSATAIRPSVILAFEEENWDAFGDPAYAERHVRALAAALDGNVPFLLAKYRAAARAHGIAQETARNAFARRVRRSDLFAPSRYAAFLLLFPPVLLIGWYVWRQTTAVVAPPHLEIYEPADHAAVADPFVKVRGVTDPTASVTINGTAAVVEPDGVFSAVLSVPRGTTRLAITARRRYGGQSDALRYITYTPPQGPSDVAPATTTPATTSTATATPQLTD